MEISDQILTSSFPYLLNLSKCYNHPDFDLGLRLILELALEGIQKESSQLLEQSRVNLPSGDNSIIAEKVDALREKSIQLEVDDAQILKYASKYDHLLASLLSYNFPFAKIESQLAKQILTMNSNDDFHSFICKCLNQSEPDYGWKKAHF